MIEFWSDQDSIQHKLIGCKTVENK